MGVVRVAAKQRSTISGATMSAKNSKTPTHVDRTARRMLMACLPASLLKVGKEREKKPMKTTFNAESAETAEKHWDPSAGPASSAVHLVFVARLSSRAPFSGFLDSQ